jgi:hypothetical protein
MKCDNPKCNNELLPMTNTPRTDGVMVQAVNSGKAYIYCNSCAAAYGIK